MDFMEQKDLGFDKSHTVVRERAYSLGQRSEAFKQELRRIPGIADAAGSDTTITGGYYYGIMFQTEQDSEIKTTRGMTIDENFISSLGLEIVEGRGFSQEFDDTWSVILNESTIREFGWEDPVGMKLKRIGDPGEPTGDYTVIGIIKDFHYNSLHEDIDSFVFFEFRDDQRVYPLMNVKLQPGYSGAVISAIEQKWNEFTPGEPFSYYFLDNMINELYKNERTSGQIFSIFSILAIVIACIGLFGLSAFMAEQRTKEIGIRKVLGSTSPKIIFLLSKDFARLVLLAFIISLPIAYYIMAKWLQNFAFRIDIQIWIFLMAGLFSLIIAQLTISYQAVKAANTDPAYSLRFE